MSNYQSLIKDAQVKAGEAAIKYCIEHNLAAWYVVTRVKSGRCPSSKCVVSGPYTTTEDASGMCIHDSYYIEYLTKQEAAALTY